MQGLRETILANQSVRTEPLEIPEWNCTVYLRILSGTERDTYETSISRGTENLRARFSVLVLADEAGRRLFRDEDAAELGKKDATVLDRIFDEGYRFNKMLAKYKDAEVKNLDCGQKECSGLN